MTRPPVFDTVTDDRSNVKGTGLAPSIEIIRRSAAMAPLSPDATFRIIDECAALICQRDQVAAVLADLPASWTSVRDALNELQRIVFVPNARTLHPSAARTSLRTDP